MTWLKQSTASTVVIGPFVDDEDGVTALTSLTISQGDIRLSKNGGSFAQTNNSAGATHMENGYYSVPLDTTDSNTLGRLRVAVAESGALPVWRDFMVLPANVWDSLFGADKLQVHVDEMTAGIITATVIATDAIDADAIADGAIASGVFASGAITADAIAANAIGASELADGAITTAKVADGALTAAKFASGAFDAVWSVAARTLTAFGFSVTVGTNNDKSGYSLSSAGIQAIWDALTSALTTASSIGKLLVDNINATISSRSSHSAADVWAVGTRVLTANTNLNDPTAAAIADAVWDESTSGHTTSGTFGEQVKTDVDAILQDTGTDGVVVAPASKTGYALASTGLDSISVTAPSGVATTFPGMVIQLWRRFFKKSTLTATELTTYADNGSTEVTVQAVSDDGTTQTLDSAT